MGNKKRKASSPLQASPSATRSERSHNDYEELRRQLASLTKRVEELESDNDSLQQRARHACLIFSGSALPEPTQGEHAVSLLQDLLSKHMEYQLDGAQVKAAFRLGDRAILAEFQSSAVGSDRDTLFRTKTRLRGSGLFISESLTPRRRQILRGLLQLKAEMKIISVFTQSGDIFIRETSSSPPVRIPDMSAVQRLAAAVSRRPGAAQPRGAEPLVRPVQASGSIPGGLLSCSGTRSVDQASAAPSSGPPPCPVSETAPTSAVVTPTVTPSGLPAILPTALGSPPRVRPTSA